MNSSATTDSPRTCARCGHSEHSHYNVADPKRLKPQSKYPCHRRGKHDMRCDCRDFKPAPMEARA